MLDSTRYCLILFSLTYLVGPVSASLYPTSPASGTVWSAGHSHNITWIDDGKPPNLDDMGNVNIELYLTAGDTLVQTLATGVNPKNGSRTVKLSPSWGRNGSDYQLRFVSKHPASTIYSAHFAITNMTTASLHQQANGSLTISNHIPTRSLYIPQKKPHPTFALPSTTPPAILSAPTPSSDTYSTLPQQNYPGVYKNPSGNDAGGTSTRRVDMEKLKFRLVFILWPAMIGLTMSL